MLLLRMNLINYLKNLIKNLKYTENQESEKESTQK